MTGQQKAGTPNEQINHINTVSQPVCISSVLNQTTSHTFHAFIHTETLVKTIFGMSIEIGSGLLLSEDYVYIYIYHSFYIYILRVNNERII